MRIVVVLALLLFHAVVFADQPAPIRPDPKLTPGVTFDVTLQDTSEPDRLEDRLHALVVSSKLDLKTAQREIATDWIAAYKKYIGSSPDSGQHRLDYAGAGVNGSAPNSPPLKNGARISRSLRTIG
jgi:hypothetical protein